MLECYIRECESLDDPLESPELMSELSDIRRQAIMRYKMESDRKRSLMAGLMMRDILRIHGLDSGDVVIGENNRPSIEGIDFNISHSARYVIMAVSDSRVGCDIEHVRERNYSVAKRFFTDDENSFISSSDNKERAFYRIWTARESYSKSTGEGILLNFREYEVKLEQEEKENEPIGILKEVDANYLGSCRIIREGVLSECRIHQWLYDSEYIISICRHN